MTSTSEVRPGAVVAGLRRVLVVLCLTQITSWGVLFYALPVLAPAISQHTGWSPTAVIGAFSAAQLVSAAVGVPVGRWLDRLGPRPIMTVGSLVAVVALVVMATARSLPWFFAGWLLIGVSMAATLYQPAFAALTRWYGERRISALTTLTLVGGLASTVFAPLTAVLADHLDWRRTYLVLAVLITDRWGSHHYGRLTGILHAPLTVTAAIAPWLATALAERLGGYPTVFLVLAAAGALAALLATRSVPPGAH